MRYRTLSEIAAKRGITRQGVWFRLKQSGLKPKRIGRIIVLTRSQEEFIFRSKKNGYQ